MTVLFYYTIASPPCRAVLFTLMALKIPFEKREIDITKGQHLTSEYLQKNIFHTIPMIEDDGLILWDSHAINMYLCRKYDKKHELYPEDIKKGALVDRQLFFDTEFLFPRVKQITHAVVNGSKSVTPEQEKLLRDAYVMVEQYFNTTRKQFTDKPKSYVAGDEFSIADFSFVASLTTMNIYVPPSKSLYPQMMDYLELCTSQLPNYKEINQEGLEQYKKFLTDRNYQISGVTGGVSPHDGSQWFSRTVFSNQKNYIKIEQQSFYFLIPNNTYKYLYAVRTTKNIMIPQSYA